MLPTYRRNGKPTFLRFAHANELCLGKSIAHVRFRFSVDKILT